MSEHSDQEILKHFRNENTRHYGFNLLVHAYQERIYWHVRRIVIDHEDANDIIQDVFVKIWKNLDNFREDSKLYTWIYRIATNEALSFLKKKRTFLFIPLIDVENRLAQSLRGDQYFSGDEIKMKLQKAILKLPEKQRIVFNMKYFEEMTYRDMSEILGTSIGALKASYHIAVKKIEESVTID
jgi:RNA polymerase sigma-70 factor (ECF subfamily)